MRPRHLMVAATALTLSGCISPVDYGKIRHTDYVADPRCAAQPGATVDEVANLVVYTCSPLASATTGAALRVDGGGR